MTVFLILQILIVVALVATIIVQKTSSDGFTNGSGGGNSLLNVRASANLFTRMTAILATAFIVNSLALAYMASQKEKEKSIIDKAFEEKNKQNSTKNAPKKEKTEKKKTKPAKPSVPISEEESDAPETSEEKNVVEQIKDTVETIPENVQNTATDIVDEVKSTAETIEKKVEDEIKPEEKKVPVSDE
jgi:preprotein translocase subunit SecG